MCEKHAVVKLNKQSAGSRGRGEGEILFVSSLKIQTQHIIVSEVN